MKASPSPSHLLLLLSEKLKINQQACRMAATGSLIKQKLGHTCSVPPFAGLFLAHILSSVPGMCEWV